MTLPAPPVQFPGESSAQAADRLIGIARDLTTVAEEYEARARAFRERAQEYVAHAQEMRKAVAS